MGRERPQDDPAPGSDALVEALESHRAYLRAAARVITLNEAEAEDLVQTTFEIALRHLHDLREPTSLRSWLLTTQTREAFRVRRRLRRFVRLDDGHLEPPSDPDTPQERLEVWQALERLSPRVRTAVALHHMAGLSVAETARALGTTENTVKTQLKAGLARLRAELRDG